MDDELLLRVLTGTANARQSEAAHKWRNASADNARRYAELERMLDDVTRWYAAGDVPEPPSALALVRQAGLRHAATTGDDRIPWRRRLVWPAAIAAGVVFMIGGYAIARVETRANMASPELAAVELNSDASGLEPVLLNDGTRVVLGPGSHLRIANRTDIREVWLEGRAEFEVAHNAARPFRVRTTVGEARDLGTRFVVRADARTMQVIVFEGRVAVGTTGAAGGDLQLGAGERGSVLAGHAPQLMSSGEQGESRPSRDWLRAALVFDGLRIDQVAPELEARYHLRVVVADSAIARRVVSAWFMEMPTSRAAVTAICRAVAAHCRFKDSTVVVSSSSQ